ncbi:hypothetical protein ACF0H5_007367 [Mactra antiquata]
MLSLRMVSVFHSVMSRNNVRNMYMCNNPPCYPWVGHHNNRQVFPHGPSIPTQRHPLPYHMLPPPGFHMGINWQGPGPSRPRGRGYRRGRGTSNHSSNREIRHFDDDPVKDVCCKCGERLQNCEEPGIHMCDGGHQVYIHHDNDEKSQHDDDNDSTDNKEEDLDTRLEKLLESLKDFVRSKHQSVTEALEEYVSGKIEEVTTLHRENSEEKEALEKLKKELEDKAKLLTKQEKELKDKQRRLSRDQDAFKREMKKEQEEVCRQWQQLRDEITRMEELHKIQKRMLG